MSDEAKRKDTVLKLQRLIIDKVPFVQSRWGNHVMGWWPEVRKSRALLYVKVALSILSIALIVFGYPCSILL